MTDADDVCVLVPTYNEAATVADVVTDFREQGFENVLVIDGGSTDETRALAEEAGARVLTQAGSGKGQAVREAIHHHVRSPVVLLVDGDSTYRADDAEAMLEPIRDGRADHVIGNRFADMQAGAMTLLNRVGNRIINRAFSIIHGRYLNDILSGYRAFTLESARRLHLGAEGFGIETEMAVECVKHDVPVSVVPITYEPRPAESETNLRPVRDGAQIILTLYQMAKTNNPLFYFGSVGITSTVFGLVLAAYVGYEWFVFGISHEVIAFLSGSSVLFGVQLLMFGVLSDMIVAVNREQTRQLQQIARRVEREDEGDSGVGAPPGEPAPDPDERPDPASPEPPSER